MKPHGPALATVSTAVLLTVLTNMPVFLVGALASQITATTHLPVIGIGLAVGVYWASAAVSSGCTGLISRLLNEKRMGVASILMAIVSLTGSAAWIPSWPWLVVWAGLGGLGNGLGHPSSNFLLVTHIRPSSRGLAFGVKQAAVPLAGLVAGGSVPLIALTIGWTHAFLLAALMGAVALIPVALCKPGNVGKGQQDRNRSLDRRLVFPFVLMATMTMFAAGAANSAIAFSVTGALEHGMDAGGAGLLLAIGSAAGASIRILAGRVADKTRLEPLPLIRLAMLACAAGLTLMAIPQTWSYIAGFLLASGIGWGWPGLIHYLVSHTAPHAAAEATGIVQTGSYIGSAVGPMVAGVVLGSGTQTMMWLMLATMAAAAVAISYPVRRQIGSRPIDE